MPRSSTTTTSLLLVVALVAALGTATAAAHGGTISRCAATFKGCAECDVVDGAFACTKCQPNSTWNAATAACECNSQDGWGVITQEAFDQYAAAYCQDKEQDCKPPVKYSAVAGKCVQCEKFFSATSADGVCGGFTAVYSDTKLTIANGLADPGTGDWSPAWITVNMGQCEAGCNFDPIYLVPRNLKPGSSTNQQGWNPAASADLTADLTFCDEWKLPDVCLGAPKTIRIEAGNPKVGHPWVTIGGNKKKFHKKDINKPWSVTVDGHSFTAIRKPDLDTAKDIVVTLDS